MMTKFEISNILTNNISNDIGFIGIGVGKYIFVYMADVKSSLEMYRKLDMLFELLEDRDQIKIQISGNIKPL